MTDRLISLAFVALILLILFTAFYAWQDQESVTQFNHDRFTRFDPARDRGTP